MLAQWAQQKIEPFASTPWPMILTPQCSQVGARAWIAHSKLSNTCGWSPGLSTRKDLSYSLPQTSHLAIFTALSRHRLDCALIYPYHKPHKRGDPHHSKKARGPGRQELRSLLSDKKAKACSSQLSTRSSPTSAARCRGESQNPNFFFFGSSVGLPSSWPSDTSGVRGRPSRSSTNSWGSTPRLAASLRIVVG